MSEDSDILDRPLAPIRERLRFSASAASKYHNCHASANLEEAIPGFEHRKKPRAKSRDQGTALHKVMELALTQTLSLREVAAMLRELSAVFGKKRTLLLESEKDYIIWWFMLHNEMAPIEHKVVAPLLFDIMTKPDEDGNTEMETISTPPKIIRFLASAMDVLAEIMDNGGVLVTEQKREARWMETKPSTTVDILIRQGKTLYVIDLKAGVIPIEAIENEQLMYYAKTFVDDETELVLMILQDGNFSTWSISRDHLDNWATAVQASEQAILAGDLSFNPGSHCGFCPANPRSKGDNGYPFCPIQIEILYGDADNVQSDLDILED